MKTYDTYKDSGIEWIGKIPEHWEVKKFKHLFLEHSGNGFPHDFQGTSDGEVPFFKVSDLNKDGISVEYAKNYVSFKDVKENRWNIVPAKSILTAKIGEALKKNHRKISTVQCIIDNNCLGIESFDLNENYAFYLLRVIDFDWFINPGAVPSISMEKLRNNSFPVSPSNDEQTAIATYLDRKTADIDELIADKKRLLELYEEEKTAIINQAVTKGLDPNVPMQDSGIEWLGEIPEHWEVKKLKYVASINPTKKTSNKELNKKVVFLPMEKVGEDGSYNCDIKRHISELWNGFTYFEKGDIIIAKITPCFENGKGAFLNELETRIGFGSTEFHVLRSSAITPKLIYFITRSELFMELGEAFMTGAAGQKRVPSNFISEFRFCFSPSFKEQQSIVHHIESECKRIDLQVERTKALIDLLKEYREALISEVVTGKVKVT